MGNITAHAAISCFASAEVQKVVSERFAPRADLVCLELGNFLTDLSQTRDPTAYMSTRRIVIEEGSPWWGIFPIFPGPISRHYAEKFANELLGCPGPTTRHGALAKFFFHLSLALTHLFFAADSKLHTSGPRIADDSIATGVDIPLILCLRYLGGLPPDELDRIFLQSFTQYYPHEHLDFPPIRDGPNHRSHRLFQRGRRGLIVYLEEQIQFLSEELTKLELNWVLIHARANPNPRNKRDLLVKLGHLLHAVEDFFFHTSFVEVRHWQRLLRLDPGADPRTPAGYERIMSDSLRGTRHTRTLIRLRRCLNRRVRYPVYEARTRPSRQDSLDATDLVYSGGFGETDVMHTVGGALEAIEEALSFAEALGFSSAGRLRNSDLILIRLMFNEAERRKMVNEDLKNAHVERHRRELAERRYEKEITRLEAEGDLSSRAAEEFRRALEIDRALERRYSSAPGVGGFLIRVLEKLQRTVDESERGAKRLDSKWRSVLNTRSDNGVSAETIGTHSLMAKDSVEKEPLRIEAVMLAKHASASVATQLLRRVVSDSRPSHGIDWDSVLRHYLKFPRLGGGQWENEVLLKVDEDGRQPVPSEVRDQPKFRLLGPDYQAKKLKARRAGSKKGELEERYERLEGR